MVYQKNKKRTHNNQFQYYSFLLNFSVLTVEYIYGSLIIILKYKII